MHGEIGTFRPLLSDARSNRTHCKQDPVYFVKSSNIHKLPCMEITVILLLHIWVHMIDFNLNNKLACQKTCEVPYVTRTYFISNTDTSLFDLVG